MKNSIRLLSLIVFSLMLSISLSAQNPPHPDDDAAGGGTGNGGPIGGAAGLAGGIGILLAMGGAYGARKVYSGWKKLND